MARLVRRVCGHCSIGPSGVFDQSIERISFARLPAGWDGDSIIAGR
jgi:hypothetical protein